MSTLGLPGPALPPTTTTLTPEQDPPDGTSRLLLPPESTADARYLQTLSLGGGFN